MRRAHLPIAWRIVALSTLLVVASSAAQPPAEGAASAPVAPVADEPAVPVASEPAVPVANETSVVPPPPAVNLTVPRLYVTKPLPAWAHPKPFEPEFREARSSRFLIGIGAGMIAAALTHLPFAHRSLCQPGPRSRERTVHVGTTIAASIGFGFVLAGGIRLALARHAGAPRATTGQAGGASAFAGGAYGITSLALMTSLIGTGVHWCRASWNSD